MSNPAEDEDETVDLVRELRSGGHSERAIADYLEVSQSRVHRILAELGESVDVPERITGRDGRSRPAQRSPRASTATVSTTRENGPVSMTSTELQSAAWDAVAGHRELVAATEALRSRRAELTAATGPQVRTGAALAEVALSGPQDLSGVDDLIGEELAAAGWAEARLRTVERLTEAGRELRARHQQLCRDRIDDALAWLHERLGELVAQARPAVRALNGVRSPADLLTVPDPAAARDGLLTVQGLAERHSAIRAAQCEIVTTVASEDYKAGHGQAWKVIQDAVRAHPCENMAQLGAPPADPVELLVFLCRDDARPWVPSRGELKAATQPGARPPKPAAAPLESAISTDANPVRVVTVGGMT